MPFGERGNLLGGFPRLDGSSYPRFSFYRKSKERTEEVVKGDYSRYSHQREETRPLSLYDDCEDAWCKSGDSSSSTDNSAPGFDTGSPESCCSFQDDRSAKSLIPYRGNKKREPVPRKTSAKSSHSRLPQPLTAPPGGSTPERHHHDARETLQSNEKQITAAPSVTGLRRFPKPPRSKSSLLPAARGPRYENIEHIQLQNMQSHRSLGHLKGRLSADSGSLGKTKPSKLPRRVYVSENFSASVRVGSRRVVEENFSRRLMTEYSASESDATVESSSQLCKNGAQRKNSLRRKGTFTEEASAPSTPDPFHYSYWQPPASPSRSRVTVAQQRQFLLPSVRVHDEGTPSSSVLSGNREDNGSLSSRRPITSGFVKNKHVENVRENDDLSTSADEQPQILNTVVFKNSSYISPRHDCRSRKEKCEATNGGPSLSQSEHRSARRDTRKDLVLQRPSYTRSSSSSQSSEGTRRKGYYEMSKAVVPQSMSASEAKVNNSVPLCEGPGTKGKNSVSLCEGPGTKGKNSVSLCEGPGTKDKNSVPLCERPGTKGNNSVPLCERPGTKGKNSVPLSERPGTKDNNSVPLCEGPGTTGKISVPLCERPATKGKDSVPLCERPGTKGKRREQSRKVSFQSPVPRLLLREDRTATRPKSSLPQRREQTKVFTRPAHRRDDQALASAGVATRHPGITQQSGSVPAGDDVMRSRSEDISSSSSEDSDVECSWPTEPTRPVERKRKTAEERRTAFQRKLRCLCSIGLIVVLVASVCLELTALFTGHWAVSPRTHNTTTCGPIYLCHDQECQHYPDGAVYVACGFVCVSVGILLQLLSVCTLLYSLLLAFPTRLCISLSILASGIFLMASAAFFWHNLQQHCSASRLTLSGEDASLIAYLTSAAISGSLGLTGMVWQIVTAYASLCGTYRPPQQMTWV